ncbi:MAG: GntR family transcriptional regulator [Proteobacteria bacterium]|nr:GntR family transcriptional regulator [Pseudomonadota bacterium]
MRLKTINSWLGIRAEVLSRIYDRTWKPGDLIPKEIDLAFEFGCSRTTVNRALRELAEAGTLERRRKSGTRVSLNPANKATLKIPLIKNEVNKIGKTYGYKLIQRKLCLPPDKIKNKMRINSGIKILHILALHTANDLPFVIEDRWINQHVLPESEKQNFKEHSANEWLVLNAPYTHGTISFSAINSSAENAHLLSIKSGAAVFEIERNTFDKENAITNVCLTYERGYRMLTTF